jgi:probable O-glycosylation ligase (exosortase A-associated)
MAWDKFNVVFKIILPSLLICNSLSKERDLQIITATFAASIGIWATQASIHGLIGGGAVENMKIGGQMSERNDFAVGVVMTWPLCYYWGVLAENKKIKIAAYTASFFVGLCAIVSNSRGAMLGLFLLLFMNFLRKGTKRGRNFVIILISIPMIIPLIPQYALDRLGTIKVSGEQTEGSAKSRTVLMKAGLAGARDNPFFGVGTGCWGAHYMKYVEKMGDGAYEPHSIWIKISVELGFIGLGTYLFMFFRIIMNLRRIQKKGLRTKNIKVYNYAAMLQLSLIGYCAAGSFINQIFYEYMFLLVGTSGAFIKMYQEGVFDPQTVSAEKSIPVKKANRYQRRAA